MRRGDTVFIGVVAGLALVAGLLQIPVLQKNYDRQKESQKSNDITADLPANNTGVYPDETSLQSSSYDTRVKTYLTTLATHLEVYYNDHGGYPSGGDLNSLEWLEKNMPDLEEKLPLVEYSYETTPSGCKTNECTSFMLSTQLMDNSVFTKKSLN